MVDLLRYLKRRLYEAGGLTYDCANMVHHIADEVAEPGDEEYDRLETARDKGLEALQILEQLQDHLERLIEGLCPEEDEHGAD